MYLSTFQVLYKLYLSTDVLKYKVLLPGSDVIHRVPTVMEKHGKNLVMESHGKVMENGRKK